uniref:Uncharacterized protein n=1 Tax=Nelumbo nucifera TaxID=4432 RepID=A0A822YDR8_NELNU|nr:TPA_asm: hypothetical protein HUJ06_009478 [Nelumbo nucifera]
MVRYLQQSIRRMEWSAFMRILKNIRHVKSQMIDHIDSSIQRIMALSKKLTAVDEHISCGPAYLAKIDKRVRLISSFTVSLFVGLIICC